MKGTHRSRNSRGMTAAAGRTEVRMEALRAMSSFGAAEAVPLTLSPAAVTSGGRMQAGQPAPRNETRRERASLKGRRTRDRLRPGLWAAGMAFCLSLALLPARGMAQAQVAPPLVNRAELVQQIGFDQHPGAAIPLDLPFLDEHGQSVELQQYFRKSQPVLLMLVYYRCPMLCDQIMNGVTRGLENVPFTAGRDFQIVTVSIDPTDKPADGRKKKTMMLTRYGRAEAASGWHFLTGPQPSIHALTQAVGFRYAYDPALNQYAHAAGIVLLTPEGKISRYLFGVEYRPRDLRLGLVQASQGSIGGITDQVLLLCYHYNPVSGKYDALVGRLLFWGGVLILLIVGGGLALLFWMGPKPVPVDAEEPAAADTRRE